MNGRRLVFSALALVLPEISLLASACSFVDLDHAVAFKPGQSTLQATEIGQLANWYVDKKILHGIGEIGIFASAIRNDAPSSELARRRIANVADVIASLDGSRVRSVSVQVREVEANSPEWLQAVDRADVIVQPACLKSNTCCPTSSTSDGVRKP